MNEFSNRYNVTIEEVQQDLQKIIDIHCEKIIRRWRIEDVQSHKNNHYAYHLGNTRDKDDIRPLMSPFHHLKEMILSQPDFIKKQYDICRFVSLFCREPLIEQNEDIYWGYCIKTNTKLFPYSLYELAKAFTNGDDYAYTVELLCSKQGILSENGDTIIDQYTGYELKKINYNEDEEYNDAGFKIITHQVMQSDIPSTIYEDETLQKIHNICSSMCKNIHIHIDDQLVVRLSNELASKHIKTKEKYYRDEEKRKKKENATIRPYELYRDEFIIMITASVLLIYIQTSIPSFHTKKTFPGCIFSFIGYPYGGGGEEDMSSIKYFACVLKKMKTTIAPWNSLTLTEVGTGNYMQNIIKTYIINHPDIDRLAFLKREYRILHPEDEIINEKEIIEKWVHFLPPIVPFTISTNIPTISGETVQDLFHLIEKGDRHQREQIAIIKGKLTQYAFGIIEKIYHIIKSKDVLLKTLSNIPFLDNACCNERMDQHVIAYFAKEEPIISKYILASMELERTLSYVHELSVTSMYYFPKFTGLKNGLVLPNGYTEETMYSVFIHYCHLDKDSPIPSNMIRFMSEKPIEYNKYWTIMEKIDFLKRNGKRFEMNDLYHLIRIINQEHIIEAYTEPTITEYSPILEFLETMEQTNSSIIPDKLRETLTAYISNKDDVKQEITLMNYLITANSRLFTQIMNFLNKYGNMNKTEHNIMNEFLSQLNKWKNEDIYIITQFIKNAIMGMAKVNPSIIRNEAKYEKIPIHWNLARHHAQLLNGIIDKYNQVFQRFKKNDVLNRFLSEITDRLNDICVFVSVLPMTMKKEIVMELYLYNIYSCIYEYTVFSDEIIQVDGQHKKKMIRIKKQEMVDDSEQIFSNELDDTDSSSEIDFDTDSEDLNILEGNLEELKNTVGRLLFAFLELEYMNKKLADNTYQMISKKVFKTKQQEKDEITKFFGEMDVDDRKIENSMKKYKLERWNAGLQSGLTKYDKKLYSSQFEENEKRLYNELEEDGIFDVRIADIDHHDEEDGEEGDMENPPPVIAYGREFPSGDDEYNGYDSGDGDGDYNDDDDNGFDD
jgi:hypothetical protein